MINDLKIINIIGEQITGTLDFDEVVSRLYIELSKIMDADGFIIYLLNSEKNILEVKHKFGKHKNIVYDDISMDSPESFCVYSVKNKSEIFINDVRKEYSKYLEKYYWNDAPDEEVIHSFINIPLVMQGTAFGVISVQSYKSGAYTEEHLMLLKSIANYMSIAFKNAETFLQLNNARKNIAAQKREIEEKNEDILSSIRYAQRIQNSLMPTEKYIQRIITRLKK